MQTSSNNLIELVDNTLGMVEISRLTIPGGVFGTSTIKIWTLLNWLCSKLDHCRHLHIGINQGGSLIAALWRNPEIKCWAIDNYCQGNGGCFPEAIQNLKKYGINQNIINEDCFGLLPDTKNQIVDVNLYFYDAEHTQ